MGWSHIMAIFAQAQDISHVAWSVLVVLAKLADSAGECWPSVAYLVEKTKLSERSVQRGIRELVVARLVELKSGRGNRHVNHYRLTDRVMNLSTGVPDSHPSKVPHSHLSNGEGCHTVTLKVPHSHLKGATVAHGREEIKNNIKQSQSQCPHPSAVGRVPQAAGPAETPEEVPVKPGTGREMPPSAAGYESQQRTSKTVAKGSGEVRDYKKLLKEYGWKPRCRKDIEAAVSCCYELGADAEEAKSFARYNNIRKWDAICDTVSVYQLAKEWVRRWKWRTPSEWEYERSRRIEEARRRKETAELAAIADARREKTT